MLARRWSYISGAPLGIHTHFTHSSAHLIPATSVLFPSHCPLFCVSPPTVNVPPMQSWMDGGTLLPCAHLTLTALQIHHHTTLTNSSCIYIPACSSPELQLKNLLIHKWSTYSPLSLWLHLPQVFIIFVRIFQH